MQEFLLTEQVKWKFSLSRTSFWGGNFERMVGLVKQCLYKATRKAKFMKQELEEVILDKLKQSTVDICKWRYSISGIDTEHSNIRATIYNTRRTT